MKTIKILDILNISDLIQQLEDLPLDMPVNGTAKLVQDNSGITTVVLGDI